MELTNLVESSRGGVFHICALHQQNMQKKVGSGTGFWCRGHLVTNHHVMNAVGLDHVVWVRREGDEDPEKSGLLITAQDWRRRIKTTSAETSYDYAIMDVPELAAVGNVYEFDLQDPVDLKVGTSIAFLGYPLEHQNLTCHGGIISSFYKKKSARVIQIDGSVNGGNSGGPLMNIANGKVIGVVSRKATGLSAAFDSMRAALQLNIDALSVNPKVFIQGMALLPSIADSQRKILEMTHEIERQANVGIGYAFSAKHLLDENIMNPM